MDLEGKHQLHGTPEQVWNALHDTVLLARCVPGCKQIEWIGTDTLEAEMRQAAAELRFEYAAKLRDEIKSLRREFDIAVAEARRGGVPVPPAA